MKTTLVTGASGFIGSHLMREFALRGLPARGVARSVVPSLIPVPSYDAHLNWQPYLTGIGSVVHLAARVHVMKETEENPLVLFRQANVQTTLDLAKQSVMAGVKRFVFLSSIKVNGEHTRPDEPFTADDPPNPQDPYAVSKAEAEAALTAFGAQTGLEIVIIRPPLVSGRLAGGNFQNLVKWVEWGLPSPFAAVKNKRSLVNVWNLCDLIIATLNHPNAANRTFLVSDGRDLSTDELFRGLSLALGKRPRSIRIDPAILRTAGRLSGRSEKLRRLVENLQVEISATRDVLSWTPPFGCFDRFEREGNSEIGQQSTLARTR